MRVGCFLASYLVIVTPLTAQQTQPPPASSPGKVLGKLLVEDHPAELLLFYRYLVSLDYPIASQEALKKQLEAQPADRKDPALVEAVALSLLDASYPIPSPLDALKHVSVDVGPSLAQPDPIGGAGHCDTAARELRGECIRNGGSGRVDLQCMLRAVFAANHCARHLTEATPHDRCSGFPLQDYARCLVMNNRTDETAAECRLGYLMRVHLCRVVRQGRLDLDLPPRH